MPFCFIPAATTKGKTFKGEVLVQHHTSSTDANPLFGGPSPVGIGVEGLMDGTALGEGQPDLQCDLRKLADTD